MAAAEPRLHPWIRSVLPSLIPRVDECEYSSCMAPISTCSAGASRTSTARPRWLRSTRNWSTWRMRLAWNWPSFSHTTKEPRSTHCTSILDSVDGAIINPAGLTQHGVSLHDAIKAMLFPVVEAHMTNLAAREEWRHRSIISPALKGTVLSLGWRSYTAALRALAEIIAEAQSGKAGASPPEVGRDGDWS